MRVLDHLLAIVKVDADQTCGKPLLELGLVVATDQENVFLVELAIRLLRHFSRLAHRTVVELQSRKNRLELWLCLEWDVLDRHQSDLHRVELFA